MIQNDLNSQYMNSSEVFNGTRSGLSMADFLLGTTSSFTQGGAVEDVERQNYFSPYVQDIWKFNSHLTINAGIRWEPFFPLYTKYDHVEHFNMADFLAGTKSTVYTNAPAGLLFPGDPGSPGNRWTNGDAKDFAPRLAISYDPRGKGLEVIRAAYGIFYDATPTFYFQGGAGSAPWGSAVALVNVQLSNPWASYPGGNPFPVTLGKNVVFPTPGTYDTAPLNTKRINMQQWNLSIQKQIRSDLSITATYLGNKTTHSWLGTQLNPATYIPGASTTGNVNQRRVLYLLNPSIGQYYGSITELDPGGNGEYEAAMLNVQKRLSHNFSVLTNYTYSHCINEGDPEQILGASYQNPYNRDADRGSCLTDRRQVLNTTAVFMSPTLGSGAMAHVTGGWQFSAIFAALSGLPVNITSGIDQALSGQSSERPNLIGNAALSNPTTGEWFNTSAFALPALGTYGNLGRDVLTGPGQWNLNVALVRKFAIHERQTLEFRAEGFNVLNHTELLNPNGTENSSLFGKITTANDPRIMQLAMKFVF